MLTAMLSRLAVTCAVCGVVFIGTVTGSYVASPPPAAERDDTARIHLAAQNDGALAHLSSGATHYKWFAPSAQPATNWNKNGVIVFIHGLSLPSFIFEDNARALTDQGFRVLTYDLLGRGLSDRPDTAYDMGLFLTQLTELLKATDISQPVHLIGYSLGATIAAAFAAEHPGTVDSVTLIAPTAAGPAFNEHTTDLLHMANDPVFGPVLQRTLAPATLNMFAALQFSTAPERDRLRAQYDAQRKFKGYIPALLSTAKNVPLTNWNHPYYKKLGATDIPVLVIWGEGDNFAPFANIRHLKAQIPNLLMRTHPTADHNIPFANPEFVNASLQLHFAQLTWAD